MINSFSDMFRNAGVLRKVSSKRCLDKWILLLVSFALFLPWVELPLSGGTSSLNLSSPFLFSWGLLLLPIALLAIGGFRWDRFFLFLLFILVLSFPVQIHWDYELVQNVISEVTQKENIREFAERHIYASNIVNSPADIDPTEIGDFWDDPWVRVGITAESLGVGFWIAFVGTVFVSRKLGIRRIIIAGLFIFFLSLPAIITAYFLSQGRHEFLSSNYVESLKKYGISIMINQTIGNNTLEGLESYHIWVGESILHTGVGNSPEVYMFLGNNLFEINAFVKSKDMYEKAIDLPPANKALARTMVKEAVNDVNEKRLGSAIKRLEEAIRFDRSQVEALFYATYISFVLKDEKSTLYYSSLLFDRCKEKTMRSDVYNILGDMYHEAGKFAISRPVYRRSIDSFDRVKQGNDHAWKGISGR